jgi:site-specific DNA recombinase
LKPSFSAASCDNRNILETDGRLFPNPRNKYRKVFALAYTFGYNERDEQEVTHGGMTMKVLGYCRVSTDEQANHGQSLDAQRAKLEAYAKLYDLELVEVITDAGVSAKSLDRPGLQKVLVRLKKGEVDGVIICKLDRLTRSVGDWQELIDEHFSSKAGKQLFSVADSIDTRTAAGRMVLNVLLSVAQWEREAIGERTRDALQFKISKGERCGKVRFGFSLADDGVNLIPNGQEQEAIRLMLELRQAGETYRAIATELNARGIRTKEGGAWQNATVRQILARAA